VSDWYERGRTEIVRRIKQSTGLSENDIDNVYAMLSEIGLIDYDIEKDVFYTIIHGEEG
jgi:hypothetical protein